MNNLVEVKWSEIEEAFSKEMTLEKGHAICAGLLSLRLAPDDDKEAYELVRRARLEAKGIKVAIEKTRKNLVLGANNYVNSVNSFSKELVGTFSSGLDFAEALELGYVDAKKREKDAEDNARAAKKAGRIALLFGGGMMFDGTVYKLGDLIISPLSCEIIPDDLFAIFLQSLGSEKKKIAELAIIEAEKRRLEAEIEEKRIAVEREAARLINAEAEKKRADEYAARMAEVTAARELLSKQMSENEETIRKQKAELLAAQIRIRDNEQRERASVLAAREVNGPPIAEGMVQIDENDPLKGLGMYKTIQEWANGVKILIEKAPDQNNPVMQRCLVALRKVYELASKEVEHE